jgi:hypothetical protein
MNERIAVASWTRPVGTNFFNPDGTFLFHDAWAPNTNGMFYRMISP